MRVFYVLSLALAVLYHCAALLGLMPPCAPLQYYAPLGLVLVAFVVAAVTHPKSTAHGQGFQLTWQDAVAHVGPIAKWSSLAGFCYGILICAGAIMRAQGRLGTPDGVATEEVGPVGVTGFGLAFGVIAWMSGITGLNLKAELIRRGEWFR